MIAVGTSHGHIMAFDILQTLRWSCQEHLQQGAVSALAFNRDSSRLLAGYARGDIVMIDTASGDSIRVLTDAIAPNSGCVHLKWTEKPTIALCSDTGGSVWSLNFTRRLGKRSCDSRCLFSGARGEVMRCDMHRYRQISINCRNDFSKINQQFVFPFMLAKVCAVEPLVFDEEHPLRSQCIVAMATLSKFFVITIRPRLKVIKFQPLQGSSDTLPLISWQLVVIQSADSSRVTDPVLAVARGPNIFFHQVSIAQNSRPLTRF